MQFLFPVHVWIYYCYTAGWENYTEQKLAEEMGQIFGVYLAQHYFCYMDATQWVQ